MSHTRQLDGGGQPDYLEILSRELHKAESLVYAADCVDRIAEVGVTEFAATMQSFAASVDDELPATFDEQTTDLDMFRSFLGFAAEEAVAADAKHGEEDRVRIRGVGSFIRELVEKAADESAPIDAYDLLFNGIYGYFRQSDESKNTIGEPSQTEVLDTSDAGGRITSIDQLGLAEPLQSHMPEFLDIIAALEDTPDTDVLAMVRNKYNESVPFIGMVTISPETSEKIFFGFLGPVIEKVYQRYEVSITEAALVSGYVLSDIISDVITRVSEQRAGVMRRATHRLDQLVKRDVIVYRQEPAPPLRTEPVAVATETCQPVAKNSRKKPVSKKISRTEQLVPSTRVESAADTVEVKKPLGAFVGKEPLRGKFHEQLMVWASRSQLDLYRQELAAHSRQMAEIKNHPAFTQAQWATEVVASALFSAFSDDINEVVVAGVKVNTIEKQRYYMLRTNRLLEDLLEKTHHAFVVGACSPQDLGGAYEVLKRNLKLSR